VKILTLLSLILLWGCFPGPGGYTSSLGDDEGATAPEDKWPADTAAISSFFERFQALTPILLPNTLDNICARASVEAQKVNELELTTSFLEDGVDQTFMAIHPTLGIYDKTIVFIPESTSFQSFYDINFNPIPSPEIILPGTIVLVGILATENGEASDRFLNTYLLKLDSGNYIWYGNQKPSPDVQKAIDYGVYDYLVEFQDETPSATPTDMNDYFSIIGNIDQTIRGADVPNDFLEYGEDQFSMFTNTENLQDKKVLFNFNTVKIKVFYNLDLIPIPEPGAENILPGSIVLITIDATEDDVPSTRFSNMYLLRLDSGKYVWFGNQLVIPASLHR